MENEVSTEAWRPVIGYEGLYEVSDRGNVMSLGRTVMTRNGARKLRNRQLRPKKNSAGYYQVALFKDGTRRELLVSRLVAEAFCEKPEGCDIVNHLDNTVEHNWAGNLEWTTQKGNIQHAIAQKRMHVRAVYRGDNKYYPLMRMVEEDGYSSSAVCRVCQGKQRTHKGERFRYAGIGDGIHT